MYKIKYIFVWYFRWIYILCSSLTGVNEQTSRNPKPKATVASEKMVHFKTTDWIPGTTKQTSWYLLFILGWSYTWSKLFLITQLFIDINFYKVSVIQT